MVPTPILTADEPIPWGAAPTLRKTGQEAGTKGAIAHPPGFSRDREPEGPSGWPAAYRQWHLTQSENSTPIPLFTVLYSPSKSDQDESK